MFHSYRSFASQTPTYRLSPAYPPCICEPTVFSVDDANALNGHGFGFGSGVAVKAMGEYFERFAAFRAVTSIGMGRVADMGLTLGEQEALVSALQQTCHDEVRNEIETADFRLVEVNRLGEKTKALYPVILLSLHSFDKQKDARFAPIRDTSGSAIHQDEITAFRGALLEFVERQCMTAMWVSKRCNEIENLGDALSNSKALALHDQMTTGGRLRIVDISFLTGASVKFCEYLSRNTDALVNFSCGCSADIDPDTATIKAFTETWQTSLLLPQMEFFGAKEYGGTNLKENFQAANKPDFELGVKTAPLKVGASASSGDIASFRPQTTNV